MSLNKEEKRIFRYFMTAKVCTKSKTMEILKNITGGTTDQQLTACLDTINAVIKQMDLEIIQGRSEVTGTKYFALIQMSQAAPPESAKYSDKKKDAIFAKIISAIAVSVNKKVSKTEAVNLLSENKVSKEEIESTLNTFESEKWLEFHSGFIFLGPRALMELGGLLAGHYSSSAKSCPLCRTNVFYGISCEECSNKIHKACLKKYFQQNGSHCPSCKTELRKTSDSDLGPTRAKRPRLD